MAQAEVTIAGETYRFQEEGFVASANCTPNHGGAFQALLNLVDDKKEPEVRSNLDLALLRDGTEATSSVHNSIIVRLGHLDESNSLDYLPGWSTDAEFAANGGLEPGIA